MKTHLLAISLCAACAGAPVKPLPAWYSAESADHPRYPHARFLTGAGTSGASAQEADDRAKAAVSARINARLVSETSSFQEYSSRTGDAQRVTVKTSVSSSFDRADLIGIVERERQGELFYSFAALDRAAADRELASQAGADLESFRAAADHAKRARAAQDSGVFASALAEASRLRTALDASFIVRRAVAGRPSQDEAAYLGLRNELLGLLEEARAHRVVGVVLKNAGSSHLVDFTVNAVKSLGLRPDSASCAARDRKDLTDATELEVVPEENCSEGSLGERCEVTVRLTAQACSGGTAGAGTVAVARGIHPSDRDKARRSAWDKVTQKAIEAAVRDALKSALQIGE